MDNDERRFHLTYTALLVCSFLVDPFCTAIINNWVSPTLHVYPAAIALIWITLWFRRLLNIERARGKASRERLQELEERVAKLEEEE